MAKSWNVTVAGRDRRITVEPTETGKDVIRVDGRTASRPLTPEEQERVFDVDGHRFAVHRAPDGFTIDQIPEPAGHSAPVRPHAATPPVALPDFRLAQLTRFWWVGIIAAVALLMYFAFPSYADDASKRVEAILLDLKDGPSAESAVSTGVWARNVRSMDANELSGANNLFTRWRNEKDFNFPKGFSQYRIVDADEVEGEVPTAVVTFEVEGTTYRVLVPERRPISWAD
jgi:hypothetical protein